MPLPLWTGRFRKGLDRQVNAYNASISFDARLYRQDILGSMAHTTMLAGQGIISKEDENAIRQGLHEILDDMDGGRLVPDPDAEDIHMFIEAELTRRVGDAGKRLHTGRSRNDQVALDLRLYLRDVCLEIREGYLALYQTLISIARQHLHTIMPGYTHLQRAQPVTLAHHLMAYVEMLARDIGRLDDMTRRMDVMPLGSGALAGTTYPLDREQVAGILGFSAISLNSMDAVSDRDFVIELAAALALFMVHASRLCEELILWSSQEYAFIELDDAYSTGSSIMPQKKNPDVAELTRGKSGRVFGNLMTLLTMMKGLPLAYNKDMQEDKEAIFDSVDTVRLCLPALTGLIESMKINTNRMAEAAAGGFTNATDLADYLVLKGVPFRNAHEVSGQLVRFCLDRQCALQDLTLDEMKAYSRFIEEDVYEAIRLENCVGRRRLPGGPAPETVLAALDQASARF
ncbi:MAG: argininosuccinate lyase [Ruminococcaceae bacterium]|nr:argininosuccinate lyase [Oscillospiraceae bacterium]